MNAQLDNWTSKMNSIITAAQTSATSAAALTTLISDLDGISAAIDSAAGGLTLSLTTMSFMMKVCGLVAYRNDRIPVLGCIAKLIMVKSDAIRTLIANNYANNTSNGTVTNQSAFDAALATINAAVIDKTTCITLYATIKSGFLYAPQCSWMVSYESGIF